MKKFLLCLAIPCLVWACKNTAEVSDTSTEATAVEGATECSGADAGAEGECPYSGEAAAAGMDCSAETNESCCESAEGCSEEMVTEETIN